MTVIRGPVASGADLAREKLEAFARMRAEFERCFLFVQELHGQRRFERVPVAMSVRYLHALWVCECKDRLLGVPHSIARYAGGVALEALAAWQQGDSAVVVELLNAKLDMLPFGAITRQIADARQLGDDASVRRWLRGRGLLLNRGFNLCAALDAIFSAPPDTLLEAVRAAAANLDHQPERIARQLDEWRTPLYGELRHPALAERNMVVMNALGLAVTTDPADRPGERTARVMPSTMPASPYAQQVIRGEIELIAPSRATAGYMPAGEAREAVINDLAAPDVERAGG